jgi:hypothetical protein
LQFVVTSFRLVEQSSTGRCYSAKAQAASLKHTSHTESFKGTVSFRTRTDQSYDKQYERLSFSFDIDIHYYHMSGIVD